MALTILLTSFDAYEAQPSFHSDGKEGHITFTVDTPFPAYKPSMPTHLQTFSCERYIATNEQKE